MDKNPFKFTLTDVIIVTRIDPPDKIGSIYLPQDCKLRTYEERGIYYGKIITAGPDCKELKEGDIVVFARMTYVGFKHEDVWYRALRERDVLAKVEGEIPC